MSEVKNYEKVTEIAGKHLGKVGGDGYKDSYDPELLVAIPRSLNREAYNIQEGSLPFHGVDVWNAYEISALTNKGLPVSGMMKIVCPSDSTYHVESKSIKLYLNSFNMTRFGDSSEQCISLLEEAVAKDLSEKLETDVRVKMFTDETADSFSFQGYTKLGYLCDLDMLLFDTFHSDYKALKTINTHDNAQVFKIQSDLLRSNCRVTNQPDWGDVFIYMEDANEPDYDSLAKYIVSHRKVSHFHEEICEMIFTHFTNAYKPDKLMVACLYTRRGGIDINPIRASHPELLPEAFLDEEIRLRKTLRQ
jgi:7-cyano-7-deazaguanine reductase